MGWMDGYKKKSWLWAWVLEGHSPTQTHLSILTDEVCFIRPETLSVNR